MSWDARRFQAWVETACARKSLVVLANREPTLRDGPSEGAGDRCGSSSGLVTALEPLTDNCRLLWIARDSAVPPHETARQQRRDACVTRPRPASDSACATESGGEAGALRRVQKRRTLADVPSHVGSADVSCPRFSDVLTRERPMGRSTLRGDDDPFTDRAVQDYHFALAPGMIRGRLPRATIATFWHIPFLSPGVLSACPWERALLEGLLGSSVLGFQTPDDCRIAVTARSSVSTQPR